MNIDCWYKISNFLILKDKIKLSLTCYDLFSLLKNNITKNYRALMFAYRWYKNVDKYKEIRKIKGDFHFIYSRLILDNYHFTELYNKLLDLNNYNNELSNYINKFKRYICYSYIYYNNGICIIPRNLDIFSCIFIEADNLEFIKIHTDNKIFALLFFNNENIKKKINLPMSINMIDEYIIYHTLYISFNKNAIVKNIYSGGLLLDPKIREKLIQNHFNNLI